MGLPDGNAFTLTSDEPYAGTAGGPMLIGPYTVTHGPSAPAAPPEEHNWVWIPEKEVRRELAEGGSKRSTYPAHADSGEEEEGTRKRSARQAASARGARRGGEVSPRRVSRCRPALTLGGHPLRTEAFPKTGLRRGELVPAPEGCRGDDEMEPEWPPPSPEQYMRDQIGAGNEEKAAGLQTGLRKLKPVLYRTDEEKKPLWTVQEGYSPEGQLKQEVLRRVPRPMIGVSLSAGLAPGRHSS